MRLIDADALGYEVLEEYGADGGSNDVNVIYGMIINAPTVDADIVCHGRWKVWYHGKEGGFSYTCSECGIHADETSDYYPTCGARMDGEADEK